MNWIQGLVIVSCWSAMSRCYECIDVSTDKRARRREIESLDRHYRIGRINCEGDGIYKGTSATEEHVGN